MGKDGRKAVYDAALQVEACHFRGVLQPFPPHFHDYYVIGLVEGGQRRLFCRNRDDMIRPGDLLLFCPGDSHGCTQKGGTPLEYRALHIPQANMEAFFREIRLPAPPAFFRNVLSGGQLAARFRLLHEEIMCGRGGECRGAFLALLSALWQECGSRPTPCAPGYGQEVDAACAFLETHFAEHISLEQLCLRVGLSKSTLLRAFTRNKGITPYRYLETLRISEAKKLLECGVPPAEAALRTGFADQSHFSRYFHRLIGLSPGAYRDIFQQ